MTEPIPGSQPPSLSAFRAVPRTGVIYVMTEAVKHGYRAGSPEWVNLGQGAAEVNPLSGAPARLSSFAFSPSDFEYAPVDGLLELREAVAKLYNARYRQGKESQYTWENVAISAGGRTALTRLASTLGRINVGHFLPDYTAYEELLDAFGTFVPIPLPLDRQRNYEFSYDELRSEIITRGLSAILLSNPSNPTGKVIQGHQLDDWIGIARNLSCTFIFDEFYSHYIYNDDAEYDVPPRLSVSAAQYVNNVNTDPVVITDGLTKNWRYPGLRVAWTVGPKTVIEAVASAGSFLDGGCSRPMQLATLPLLIPDSADQEAAAIQRAFQVKRRYMLEGLQDVGICVDPVPSGGFYCWGDLSGMPAGLNNGMDFFRLGLTLGLIVVPGLFFDIDPGKRRPDRPSRFSSFVRFSFGPSLEEVERGLGLIRKMVRGG